jgi:hypothetical protein
MRIDLGAEFKDRQRLFRADERKRQSRVAEICNTTRGNGYVFINPILPSLTPTLRQRSGRLVS